MKKLILFFLFPIFAFGQTSIDTKDQYNAKIVKFTPITAPAVTTDKLYNVNHHPFWNGFKLDSVRGGFAQIQSDWNQTDSTYLDFIKRKPIIVRGTTFVIAASNSSVLSKSQADYVCTGNGDQNMINSILNKLSLKGGKVTLLEGSFLLDTSSILVPSNVALEGMGGSTRLMFKAGDTNSFALIQNKHISVGDTNIRISNLHLDGSLSQSTLTYFQTGIMLTKVVNSIIDNCIIEHLGGFGQASCMGIVPWGCKNLIIKNNTIGDVADGINTIGTSHHILIEGNVIYSTNNDYGLNMSSIDSSIIVNNHIENTQRSGINLQSYSSNNLISGNYISNCGIRTAPQINAGIELSDGSSGNYNTITNNVINSSRANESYGIYNSASWNKITNNFLYHSGSVKPFLDNGTGTIAFGNVVDLTSTYEVGGQLKVDTVMVGLRTSEKMVVQDTLTHIFKRLPIPAAQVNSNWNAVSGLAQILNKPSIPLIDTATLLLSKARATNDYQVKLTNPVTGTGTTNFIPKFTGAGTLGNSSIFDDGTNVGIGTTDPGAKLAVNGDMLGNNLYVGGDQSVVTAGNASAGIQMFGAGVAHANITWMPNESTFAFHTGNGVRATTDAWGPANVTISGNVGIGTTAPQSVLHIYGGNGATGSLSSGPKLVFQGPIDGTSSSWASIQDIRSAVYGSSLIFSTTNSASVTDNSSEKMRIDNLGNVGIGTTTPLGKLEISKDGNESLAFFPGFASNLSIFEGYNRAGNVYTSLRNDFADYRFNIGTTEKVRIETNGNVGIGTTAPTNRIDVNGFARIRGRLWVGDSTSVYSYIDPGNATWTVSSSESKKTNIQNIATPDSLLFKMMLYGPKTYNFKQSLFYKPIKLSDICDSTKVDSVHFRKLSTNELLHTYDSIEHIDTLHAQLQSQKVFKGFIAEQINKRFFNSDSKEIDVIDLIILLWKTDQALILKTKDFETRLKTLEAK